MSEQKQGNDRPEDVKRGRKQLWAGSIALIVAMVIVCLFIITSPWQSESVSNSVDEQIAAIEATRAIPDSENAAVIYNQMLKKYGLVSFPVDRIGTGTAELTRTQPWLSKEHPEVTTWIRDHQEAIALLLEASKMEKCRFSISTESGEMSRRTDRLEAIRQWAGLLIRAANNDLGEGRIDAGIEKYLCLIQMADHLCQQPLLSESQVGIFIESVTLHRIATFVIQGIAKEEHLKTIEATLAQRKNNWSKASKAILEVERLHDTKYSSGLLPRLETRLKGRSVEDRIDQTYENYVRLLADRRGSRILIGLRRYGDKTGRWPESLDEIKSSLSKEILTDPHNGGSFVYKLTDDGFKLYSRGENYVDEGGKRGGGADDWPIWPPLY